PGHQFWPDDVTLTDDRLYPQLPGSKHLTDHFLLALAVKHGGRFATCDTGINAALVPGGQCVLHVIPTS
ncbi:MAG: VapC toxin family PIN domain ribonuclease, partial [Verrucomicrobiota bacterium]